MEKVMNLSAMVLKAFQADQNVFICGNGGSHCDAMHFAEEWTGRYRKDRKSVGALALGDAAHVTCVGNDYGFDQIFARQISGLGRKNDVLILLSTSGKSKNLLLAADAARERGLKTFALLGKGGGDLKGVVDDSLTVPGLTSDRIQELHMMALHICIEVVERELFPENY
jgi:D-sedoheptulose 7-phosphate isomerase